MTENMQEKGSFIQFNFDFYLSYNLVMALYAFIPATFIVELLKQQPNTTNALLYPTYNISYNKGLTTWSLLSKSCGTEILIEHSVLYFLGKI